MANFSKPTGINTIWANAGTKVDPGDSKYNIGWVVETPPYQNENWLQWKQDSFIAHLNQHGVPQWDAVTEYQGNISYTKGSNGIIYKALLTGVNNDPTNSLNTSYWVKAFEDFGSVKIVSDSLDAFKLNYQTLAGIANIGTARANLSVWSKVEADARYAALLGNAANTFSVAQATLPEHAVRLGQVSALLVQATEPNLGVVRLATNAQTAQGTDDLTAITPFKAANVYLSKAGNLSGLASVATARSNLGLGTAAVESATAFLSTPSNLSDVPDKAAARTNLGITSTATQVETYFLRAAQNLADVVDKAAARTNLGLTSTATTALSSIMLKVDNLSGLGNVAVARANLGLGDAALLGSGTWLKVSNNLADLSNVQAARNNLQLGGAALKNVVGVAGDLDYSNSASTNGWMIHPNGIIEQWGTFTVNGNSRSTISFPRGFTAECWNVQMTNFEALPTQGGNTCRVNTVSATNFTASHLPQTTGFMWRAIGR